VEMLALVSHFKYPLVKVKQLVRCYLLLILKYWVAVNPNRIASYDFLVSFRVPLYGSGSMNLLSNACSLHF